MLVWTFMIIARGEKQFLIGHVFTRGHIWKEPLILHSRGETYKTVFYGSKDTADSMLLK